MTRIAVVPGDGIGKEVVVEAQRVLEQVARLDGLQLEFKTLPYGADRFLAEGTSITAEEMKALGSYDAILLGALGDPRVPGNQHARDILLGMRVQLDLYVNFRPALLYHSALTPLKNRRTQDFNFVIFRENTEGVYVARGSISNKGELDEVAIQEDVNSRKGVERIIRAAFEYAQSRGLTRVTMSDKANAMEIAGGLWRRVFALVSAEYPAIQSEALYIDMLALDLVRRPDRYQVIVTNNLFGDILSDLASALVGGLGVAPSANLHPGRIGMFEPVHGSAPDIAGTGKANPLGAILSAGLMMTFLGHDQSASRIDAAVRASLEQGAMTPDLGGSATTSEVTDAVLAALGGQA